ncbi:Csu type fimbrial protein [Bordetella genomosp. 4]|uniref:Spore coat protein U n=1 Tax=Bordetella genomosp. 4 TaxID=463044 RepID=A0A261V251_9BORD|nr:spore coat U domain-containing protein [Bordetella genomosp. 4]OZI67682.1 spore coat protein U [Bordetella genomosp. 4]
MKHVLAGMLAMVAALFSPAVLAACTVSNGIANLGTLSSFAVASTSTTTQSSTGFKCTGSLLSILSTNTIDATLNTNGNALGTTPRLYSAETGAYLPYSICKDPSCGTVYNLGATIQWSSTTFLGILGLFNATDGSLPLYLRPATGIQLPKGTYKDTITVNWVWHLCAAGLLGACVYDDGNGTSTISVTLEVLNDCFIDSAPNVSFGNAALISAFTPVTQNVQVRCTPQATYSVGFDMGNNSSGGWRRMVSGANALQYNLYIPDTSTVWTTTSTVLGTGNGATQQIPYRAIINPAQSNVPAGTYTDTVRMILSY